ncbi:MAG: hypothetical protein WC897_03680 [Candidatus Gracilibacteria bacterium]
MTTMISIGFIYNLCGVIGSLILVTGAAWSEGKNTKSPIKSIKNWLFAFGALIMLIYSFLGYIVGAPVFFVILEILMVIASILMMLNVPDKIDIGVITISTLALIIWSLFLFDGYTTILFILGLYGVGLGYTLQMGSLNRSLALTAGSILIALFSYLEASWIFFWLNAFFAIFSAYYVYKGLAKTRVRK